MAIEGFVARYRAMNPSLFELVIESACEARLSSLRCQELGPMAFRLLTQGPADCDLFERLLADRVPATVFVRVDVESSQLAPHASE